MITCNCCGESIPQDAWDARELIDPELRLFRVTWKGKDHEVTELLPCPRCGNTVEGSGWLDSIRPLIGCKRTKEDVSIICERCQMVGPAFRYVHGSDIHYVQAKQAWNKLPR